MVSAVLRSWCHRALSPLFCVLACSCAQPPAKTTVAIPKARQDEAPAAPAPSAAAADASEKDHDHGEAVASGRPWLGVELEPAAPGTAGVRILRVMDGSPADAAGLVAGDVIVELQGEPVSEPSDVVRVVSTHSPGERISVFTRRAGETRLVPATLGVFPEGDALARLNFVDQPAPPFDQLETAQGSAEPRLAAHLGKVVVLEFWAPWCVACRALIPHMNAWHARLSARGLRVFGVTNERTARASLFAKQLGMEFPVLADPSGSTTRAYGARAIPMVFVIDRRGVVRDIMVGYDGDKLRELDALVERLIAER